MNGRGGSRQVRESARRGERRRGRGGGGEGRMGRGGGGERRRGREEEDGERRRGREEEGERGGGGVRRRGRKETWMEGPLVIHHISSPQDPHRLHYEYSELKVFENIECEWPLFVVYLTINGVFDGNGEEVERYYKMLENLVIKGQNDLVYVPELYLVPEDKVRGKDAPKPGGGLVVER